MAPGKHAAKKDSFWSRLLGRKAKTDNETGAGAENMTQLNADSIGADSIGAGADNIAQANADKTGINSSAMDKVNADANSANSVELVGSADFYSAQKASKDQRANAVGSGTQSSNTEKLSADRSSASGSIAADSESLSSNTANADAVSSNNTSIIVDNAVADTAAARAQAPSRSAVFAAPKTAGIGLFKNSAANKTASVISAAGQRSAGKVAADGMASGRRAAARIVLKRKSAFDSANKNAYTLMEMLMAVGIVVILMGISMVSIAAISKSLEITRLDDIARQIYISVQNELTMQKSSGELQLLDKELTDNYADHKLYNEANPSDALMPPDFFSLDDNITWKNLYWVYSEPDNNNKGLVYGLNSNGYSGLIGTISYEKQVLEGYFIIELDPKSGDCYSVFYSDQPFSYSTVNAMNLTSRERSARKALNPMIGYYGGSQTTTAISDLPDEFIVDLEVINSEELYLKVMVANLMQFINAQSNVSITIKIDDECGNSIYRTLKGGKDFNITSNEITVYMLLDSIAIPFSEITETIAKENGETEGLVPGDNLDITASAEFSMYSINIEGEAPKENVNSLFASKTVTQNNGNDEMNLEVNCLRHLNNLRQANSKQQQDYYNALRGNDKTPQTIFDFADYEIKHTEYVAEQIASGTTVAPYASIDKITVTQTEDIDFLNDNFDWLIDKNNKNGDYKVSATNPLLASDPLLSFGFTPINNITLDNNKTGDNYNAANNTIFNGVSEGDAKVIKNFIIKNDTEDSASTTASTGPTGLFGALEGWNLLDVTMIDPDVSGNGNNSGEAGNSVGALAGRLISGTVSGCGVYLSTVDEKTKQSYLEQVANNAALYENMMAQRVAEHQVKQAGDADQSGSQVGGLIGYASNTTFTESFAAINVVGGKDGEYSTAVGGLIGDANKCTFENCYSSGNVAGKGSDANRGCGGLIGNMSSGSAENCYSTSNVESKLYAGGFAGTVSAATFNNCIAYGKLYGEKKATGEEITANTANCGGFFGGSYSSFAGSTLSNCKYLYQKGYNEDYNNHKNNNTIISGLTVARYLDLRASRLEGERVMTQNECYPYIINLFETAMPLINPTNLQEHRGNWPLEYTIILALVYYERYADNVYGYYCETSLSSGGDTANPERWQLNTLQDRECVEDGYAFLSLYQLKNFTYQLDEVSDEFTVTTSGQASGNNNAQTAVRLRGQTKFVFHNMNNPEDPDDIFEANNLYVYQLPLNLQGMTTWWNDGKDTSIINKPRMAFYHTLSVSDATVSGSSATIEDYTFYYNPHFAKYAVNPDPFLNTISVPNDLPAISVRSARQLNCLGRYVVYWSHGQVTSATNTTQLNYIQETDINFGTYVKQYCGAAIDLMNTTPSTSTNIPDFCNKPIGRSGEEKLKYTRPGTDVEITPGNFKNNYDGQGHKIIDYCQYSQNYRFSGLFGEIAGSTLKNIVMTASDPDNETSTIESNYFSDTGHVPGVGALVGLVYRTPEGDNPVPNERSVVENCAVSGVVVKYLQGGRVACAVGGLCGFNMDTIKNCSAVCKHVQINLVNDSGDNYISLGGLCGVNLNTIDHCYAGGDLSIVSNSGKITGDNVSIGGICGTIHAIYGRSAENAYTQYCYSYCNLTKQSVDTSVGTNKHINYYGIAEPARAINNVHRANNTHPGRPTGEVKTIESYYLTDTIASNVTLQDANTNNSTTWPINGVNRDGLIALLGTANPEFVGDYKSRTDNNNSGINFISEPWSTLEKDYPFPFIITKGTAATADRVHYGNWPGEEIPTGYLAYWERYDDNNITSYGLYFLDRDSNVQDTLDNTKTITDAGYGILSVANTDLTYNIARGTAEGISLSSSGSATTGLKPVELTDSLENGTAVSTTYNELITLRDDQMAEFQPAAGEVVTDVPVSLSAGYSMATDGSGITDSSGGFSIRQYVHMGFAAALDSVSGQLGLSGDKPYQVRWQNQIAGIGVLSNNLPEAHIFIDQTRSFSVSSDEAGAKVGLADLGVNFVYDSQPDQTANSITNLQQPLFKNVLGTIENVTLNNSDITALADGETAVGTLAVENQGSITASIVADPHIDVTTGNAAGLVWENRGQISNTKITYSGIPAAAGQIVAADGSAAGFVGVNRVVGTVENSGTITDCSVELSAIETRSTAATETVETTAAGFVLNNIGNITNCTATINSAINAVTAAGGFALISAGNGIINECAVTVAAGAEIKSLTGTAAGFIVTNSNNSSLTDCEVIGSETAALTASAANVKGVKAAGFAAETGATTNAAAQITGSKVSKLSVASWDPADLTDPDEANVYEACGFIGAVSRAASVADCTVEDVAVLSPTGSAAGFAGSGTSSAAGAAIANCQITDSSVTAAAGMAAGFINTNNTTIGSADVLATDAEVAAVTCKVDNTVVSGLQAAGFAAANDGLIRYGTVSGAGDLISASIADDLGSAGFVFINNGTVAKCDVSGTDNTNPLGIASEDGRAAGFVVSNSAATSAITDCRVIYVGVNALNYAAGFALQNVGSIENSTVNSGSSIALSEAAGFVRLNSGTVAGSSVQNFSVGSTENSAAVVTQIAAGFCSNNSVLLNETDNPVTVAGGILNNNIVMDSKVQSVNRAAGFVVANTGEISGGKVYSSQITDPNAADTTGYNAMTVSGAAAAAGFVVNNTDAHAQITSSFAAAAVTATSDAGNAAGFSSTVTNSTGGAVSDCYANCIVSGDTAVGFANKGIIERCYALREVNGSNNSYGFTVSGTCTDCYTLAELVATGGNKYGFGSSDAAIGTKEIVDPITGNTQSIYTCFWAKENATRVASGFNSAATDATAAVAKSLYQMTKLADVDGPLENIFTVDTDGADNIADTDTAQSIPYAADLQGKYYPYPVLTGLDRYGDWPVYSETATVTFYADRNYGVAGETEDWQAYKILNVVPGTTLDDIFTVGEIPAGFSSFKGWLAAPEDTQYVDLNEFVVTGAVDFFADGVVKEHRVMVNYVAATDNSIQMSEPYIGFFDEGEPYYESSPIIPGYSAEPDIVSGNATADVDETVEYKLATYTITLDRGYGNNNQRYSTITNKSIKDVIELVDPAARSGYTFIGWRVTTAAGNWEQDDVYQAGDYSDKYGNATLTAQWINGYIGFMRAYRGNYNRNNNYRISYVNFTNDGNPYPESGETTGSNYPPVSRLSDYNQSFVYLYCSTGIWNSYRDNISITVSPANSGITENITDIDNWTSTNNEYKYSERISFNGSDSANITIAFDYYGKQYSIVRTITRNNDNNYTIN